MKLLVTGATGFIGQHLVPQLLERNHEVVGMGRSADKLAGFPWGGDIQFVVHDINQPAADMLRLFAQYDALIHLAWSDISDFNSLSHLEENLPNNYRFLRTVVESGVGHVLVSGTCYEYGMQAGCLAEDRPTLPNNPYGLAKDTLRRFLQCLQKERPFTLQWVRLFYMYGNGQNPNSLLAHLDRAIDNGEPIFNMSRGEQLLDYLPVDEVARRLAIIAEHPELAGIINCCSGEPISVRRLVEKRIAERHANIRLNLGYYPYRSNEPMAFWGNSEKLEQILQAAGPDTDPA